MERQSKSRKTIRRQPKPAFAEQDSTPQASPDDLSPTNILQLQHTIGNRAVQRLLAQRAPLPIQQRVHRTIQRGGFWEALTSLCYGSSSTAQDAAAEMAEEANQQPAAAQPQPQRQNHRVRRAQARAHLQGQPQNQPAEVDNHDNEPAPVIVNPPIVVPPPVYNQYQAQGKLNLIRAAANDLNTFIAEIDALDAAIVPTNIKNAKETAEPIKRELGRNVTALENVVERQGADKLLEATQNTKYDGTLAQKNAIPIAQLRPVVAGIKDHATLLTTYNANKADLKKLLDAGNASEADYLNYLNNNFAPIITLKTGRYANNFDKLTARIYGNNTLKGNLAANAPIIKEFQQEASAQTFTMPVKGSQVEVTGERWGHFLTHTKRYAKGQNLADRTEDTSFWGAAVDAAALKSHVQTAGANFSKALPANGAFVQDDITANGGVRVRLGIEKKDNKFYATQFYPHQPQAGITNLTQAIVNAIGAVIKDL